VVDYLSTHKYLAARAWLARHPRITLHFTPTSGSWLNLVEAGARSGGRRLLRSSAGPGSPQPGTAPGRGAVRRTAVLQRGHDLTPMSRSAGVRRHAPGRRRSVGVVKTAADPRAGRRPAHANDENSTTRQTGTTQ
jgi:hypothetical protein